MIAWITITLCLLPLVHIWPVDSMTTKTSIRLDLNNLCFGLLDEVECTNISFTVPTDVKVECHHVALGLYIKEFEKVEKYCKSEDDHATQTKNELERVHAQTKTETNCTLKMTVHKNFNDLVNATQNFTTKYNNALSEKNEK